MITRLRGLAATLALAIFVIGVPLLLLYTRSLPDFGVFTWERLKARDDGTLALAVIYIVCWVCWALFTLSVLVAVISMLRGIHAPRLPGLALPQGAANRLVASAALLFISTPAVTQAITAPPADAFIAQDPTVQVVDEPSANGSTAPSSSTHVQTPATPDPREAVGGETTTYTVKRGDSLWRIAEKHLGSGARFTEIKALNTNLLDNNPDYLEPGLVLRLPAPPKPAAELETNNDTYVVQPGDTLSEIAEEEMGDAERYPQIFEASTNTIQPDGTRLTDPDLIRPGWTIQIPDQPRPQVREGESSTSPSRPGPPTTSPRPTSPTEERPPLPSPAPTQQAEAQDAGNRDSTDEHDGAVAIPSWVLPGLTGSGAVLAGLLFLALRTYRRTALRFRRPGHILSSPPGISDVAKTAQFAGAITGPNILGLNHLLETLEGSAASMPRVGWIALGRRTVTLHLAEDVDLPSPWSGADTVWSAPIPDDAPDPEYACSYPLLVGIGSNDSGDHVLVNLEEHPYITLTGDPDKRAAFARYVSAELAFNPWSIIVIVDTFGEASQVTFRFNDLSAYSAGRANHHDNDDKSFVTEIASSLDPKIAHWDIENFHAVIATSEHADLAYQVSEIVAAYPSRAGTAVLLAADAAVPGSSTIEFTHDGRLHLPALGLDLTAAGITEAEATTCAAVFALDPDPENIPVPASKQANSRKDSTDEAGALLPEQTEPRPVDQPAGPGSVLPKETKRYVAAAATTITDIEHLAPVTAHPTPDPEDPNEPGAAEAATDDDVLLDDTVESWFDPQCPYPRLSLLGPVSARTHGDPKAVARRKPFYLEILSYLVLHSEGVTGAQMAEDFGIRVERLRTDIGEVRKWLGTNPRTGKLHLPKADTSDASGARGSAIYRVEDVLTDWDLFKRLRTRSQRRGADGIDDLITALDLVTGEPFSHLRPAGWAWLNDLRTNDIAQCAVVDAAHIVIAHALEQHDTNLALVTVEIATKASPYDEICRLDLARVKDATGDTTGVDTIVDRAIFNRTDDHQGPLEASERTTSIATKAGWIRRPHS